MDKKMKKLKDENKKLKDMVKQLKKDVKDAGKKKKSRKKRKPSAYNIFMKKEMAKYKKQHPNMEQAKVMKACAKMWKDHKKGK